MALPARRSSSSGSLAQRLDPARELEDLHRRMDQLLEGVWSPADGGGIWSPPVDVEETDDAWLLEAELPGAKQDDVNVEVRDSEVSITGEIKEKQRTGILRRRTRRTGRFEYRVTLPGEADADRVDASLHDGVLTVRIPKPERNRPRRIEVKSD
jgi:HSP20 family protein